MNPLSSDLYETLDCSNRRGLDPRRRGDERISGAAQQSLREPPVIAPDVAGRVMTWVGEARA
jgi:hypothetical protein